MKYLCLIIASCLTGCSALHPSIRESFAAITNKASWDCRDANGSAVSGCEIEGKLILTDPVKNVTYVLYRPSDTSRSHPVPCTLPAQAASALSSGGSLDLGYAGAKVGASQTHGEQITALGVNVAPALYVLVANFSLCLAYGFGAIDEAVYSQDLSRVMEKAVTLVPPPPAPPPPVSIHNDH
jgi:hypothetical protein